MKKFLALALSLAMVLGLLSGCGSKTTDDQGANSGTGDSQDYKDVKIGLLLSGNSNDGGWSQMAADAVKAAADKYPGATVNFSEALPSTDFESTMRGYADAGYTIIVAHGAEFLDTTKQVAKDYPNIKFVNTSAQQGPMSDAPSNVTGIDFATYQLGFLCGVACAMLSDSKKIGAVGSAEVDSLVMWRDGLIAGAKYIDPSCEVTSIFTGSFDDALKAKQAVDALKEKGVDIVSQNCDAAGVGAVQECQELGLMNVGTIYDQRSEGDCVAISIYQDAQLGIEMAIEEAIQGKLASGFVSMGADVGVITLGEWGGTYGDKLSAEQKDTLQKLWEQARDGVDLMSLAK